MFQTIIPMDKATVGLSFYEQLFEDGKIELIEFEEAIRQMQQIYELGLVAHGLDEEHDHGGIM